MDYYKVLQKILCADGFTVEHVEGKRIYEFGVFAEFVRPQDNIRGWYSPQDCLIEFHINYDCLESDDFSLITVSILLRKNLDIKKYYDGYNFNGEITDDTIREVFTAQDLLELIKLNKFVTNLRLKMIKEN